jgi:hypothetical protein
MSVIVIKSETTGYRILVKVGDEELARQEAVKAAISAEEARLSAIDAGASEQVATQKAAQTVEDAASALASKQDAEIAAIASEGFATDSGISATASNTAKGLSEAAKVIAIEEAGKSSTYAGQSAGSATAAEVAKNQILNKAEVNITTVGNILRSDGTLFKSISEVEFLRNKEAFARSFVSERRGNELVAFDNFTRPNGALVLSDNGLAYQSFTSVIVANQEIVNNRLLLDSNQTIFLPVIGSITAQVEMILTSSNNTLSYIIFGKDVNSHFHVFLRSDNISLLKIVNGVITGITSITLSVDAFRLASSNKVSVVNFSLFVNSANNLFVSVFYSHFPDKVLLANISNQIAGVTTSTDFTFFGLKGPTLGGKSVNSFRSIKIFQG